jgi:hypothetical protein
MGVVRSLQSGHSTEYIFRGGGFPFPPRTGSYEIGDYLMIAIDCQLLSFTHVTFLYLLELV